MATIQRAHTRLRALLHGNLLTKRTLIVIKTQAMIVGSRPNLKKTLNNASEASRLAIRDTTMNVV